MIRYKNNNIRKLPNKFLGFNRYLNTLELNNVVKIGDNCLHFNSALENLSLKRIYEIGENFLYRNRVIKQAIFPKYFFISDGFLGWDQLWDKQPVGVKNNFVKSINRSTNEVNPMALFQLIIGIVMKQTIKITNSIMNKKEMDFTDDTIKITSIKKSSSLSPIINFFIAQKDQELELEEVQKGKSK